MSALVVHYDPSQRSCFLRESKRDRQASIFEKAAPLNGSIICSQSRQQPRTTSVAKAKRTNFEKQNFEFIREQQQKNRQAFSQSVRHVGHEVKCEVLLRDKNSQAVRAATVDELAQPSPRKSRTGTAAQRFAVADNSSFSMADGAQSVDSLQRSVALVPPYLEKAIDDSRMRGGERVALQQLAVAEAEFPPGTEPLSPMRTERSREFFETQVKELSQKLAEFSFAKGQTLLGQQRKSQLEQALRQAEEQLLIFQYPVVFVHTRRPVAAPPARKPSSWR